MSSLHRSSEGENGGLSLAVMLCACAGRRLRLSVRWRVRDLLLLVGDLEGADGDLLLCLCALLLIEGASDGVGRDPVGKVASMASMSYRGLAAKYLLEMGAAWEGVPHACLRPASSLVPGLRAARALASRAVAGRLKAVMAAGHSYPMTSCAD